MTEVTYANQLALLAAYGPPEQRERAREALVKLANDQDTNADPADDFGVLHDATPEQLQKLGLPYHGSVLLMEIDAAREKQDEYDTLSSIKAGRIPRLDPRRLEFLRGILYKACCEQYPWEGPLYYHAFLTLVFIRRNTRILLPTKANRALPPTPACSADKEESTYHDEYDLIEELTDCNCCVRNVWDQLMAFLERLRMREFELQPLDEQERKWCHENDAEMQQIFFYLRKELCATNPEEFRAIWELLQKGHLDMAKMRRLWRCEQPHKLSHYRAARLLELVAKNHFNQAGLASLLCAELSAVKKVADKALETFHFNTHKSDSGSSADGTLVAPVQEPHSKVATQHPLQHVELLVWFMKEVPHDDALYIDMRNALQLLWTACVTQRVNGNQTKALEIALRQCMVDRDAVLQMARKSNITLRVTEAVRLRHQTALELTTTYFGVWQRIQDLEDVRPDVGARDMAFAVWTIIRQSDRFQVVKTAGMHNTEEASDASKASPLYANEKEAVERSFLAMRCLARHQSVMSALATAFMNQDLVGHWEVEDMRGIERGQAYVCCIERHEAWWEKYKKTFVDPHVAMTRDDDTILVSATSTRWLVNQAQCERRLKKIKDDPVAMEVYNMTDEGRMETKIRWLIFAALIVPRADMQKALIRAHYTRWLELYKVFCEEHECKSDAAATPGSSDAIVGGAPV